MRKHLCFQGSFPIAEIRMKRWPAPVYVALIILIIIALFANDVNFNVQLSSATEVNAAVVGDFSQQPAVIRLLDGEGTALVGALGSWGNRDAVLKVLVTYLHDNNEPLATVLATDHSLTRSASSTLVGQHTRLQI